MKKLPLLLYFAVFIFSSPASVFATNSQTDWPMVGADPQRTSHNNVEVRGPFNPSWTRPIDPYIDNKVQAIAADGKIFVSTAKGVYAFNAGDGSFAWNNLSDPCKCYGTEMPIGNSVTYFNGVLYAPGFDHKIHAINASSGTKLSGWNLNNFDSVGAGFDTSPLVISDSSTGNKPLVLIGNRDGKFYAFDGDTGAVKWSYTAVAPIKYSSAYKDGVVYFGDDASYAYALNVSNGGLKWKSAKFKGVGFDAYWPVIYTDTTVTPNKDWVIFTGSLKSSWVWFVGNRKTVEEINESTSPCTQTSGISYIWPSGSTIFDCSKISNWMKANPDDHISYVLDPQTGIEKTDVYAPFNPAPHDGGAQGYKQPPVVGGNNVLYTLIGTQSGGNGGATNTFFGWKFGTPYVAQVTNNSAISAASDEPRAITSGGNLLYYGEGFNHEFWGAMETNKATGSNASWIWDSRSAAGASSKFSQLTLEGKFCGSSSTCQSGSYSYFDGLQNLAPIPYAGKLYYLMGNVLVAMNSGSGSNLGLGMAPAPQVGNQAPADLAPTVNVLKQKLEAEVQKIIDVYSQTGKILRPGYLDSHHVSGSMVFGSAFVPYYIPGEHMADYFHLPSDTVTTLVNAYPYLSGPLQSAVKSYLQNMFGPGKAYDVSSVAHTGWNSGPKREWGEDTPVMVATLNGSNGLDFYLNKTPQSSINGQNERLNVGSFPPEAFYGAWKYAKLMNEQGLMTTAQIKTMFNSMSSKLVNPGSGNDLTSANLSKYPYLHNQVLTGYYGYLQLEKLAGNTSDITQSSKYAQYQSLLNSRISNFSDITWFADDDIFINVLNSAGNWMYLAPEVLNALKTSNRASQIQTVLNHAMLSEPFWFVSKYNRSFSESYNRPLFDYPSMFQANASFSGLNQAQLAKFLDVPAFEKGDLYYIQNLTAALDAPGGVVVTPVPSEIPKGNGEVNGIAPINNLDIRVILANWLKTAGLTLGSGLDQFGDSKVNSFDFAIVVKALGL